MTKKKLHTGKTLKEKMASMEIPDIEDVEPMSEEEALQYEDKMEGQARSFLYRNNPDRYWSFMQAHRLMTMLYNWIVSTRDGVFINEFCTWIIPRAYEAGKIKKFPGTLPIIGRDDIDYITRRWPKIKEMYNTIKTLQDFKVTQMGLRGEWNSSLVQLYLKTHNREEWTEIQQIETTNKTQIINVDPLSEEEDKAI